MKDACLVERLEDLCEFVGGGTPSRANPAYYEGNIPWVTPKDMGAFDVCDAEEHISQSALAESATKLVPANSVLIVVRSGVLKRRVPIAVTRVPVAINQDLKALICGRRLDARYLARLLQSREATILTWARGTTADAIPVAQLRAMQVPLPTLGEQRRIAAILDKADLVRVKRGLIVHATDTLLTSAFLDLFGGILASSGELDAIRLEDASDIASGVTKGRKLGLDVRQVPYLRVANVQDGFLDLREIKSIPATSAEIDRYRLRYGDIVLTEGGDPDKLGRGSIWRDELSECIHQNHIFRVRLTNEVFLPEYVSGLLGSSYGKKYFLKAAKQTTGIASINRTQLAAFPLLHAPVSQQRRYTAFAEQSRALMWRAENAHRESAGLLKALTRELLQTPT